jgi:hypothetical protein
MNFMEHLIEILEHHHELAEWITAVVSVLALFGVVVEYNRQKRRERVQLAQKMIERLATDEMLLFATTALDWGTAFVVVPERWRDVVKAPAIPWNLEDIQDAMKPDITPETINSPVRLLYRHAFVHLFNHLERIGNLVETGAIDVCDLRPLTWLVKELKSWRYAELEDRETVFIPSIRRWYPNGIPSALLDTIATAFPTDINPLGQSIVPKTESAEGGRQ